MGDAVLFKHHKILEDLPDNRVAYRVPLGDQAVIDHGLGVVFVPDYTREGQSANGITFCPRFLAFEKIDLFPAPVEGISFQGRAGGFGADNRLDFFRPHREDLGLSSLKRQGLPQEEDRRKQDSACQDSR
jgi:hypothetical protein